jgi:hypothetical protein
MNTEFEPEVQQAMREATWKTSIMKEGEDDVSADPMSSVEVDSKLDEYIEVHTLIKARDAATKVLSKKLAELEAILLEVMTDQHRKRGGYTIYKQRQLHVSCPTVNRGTIVKLADELGISNMVTVQSAALKSLVREYLGEDWDLEAVPKELRENLNISTNEIKLRVLKVGD